MKILLRYSDFWPNFEPKKFFLTELISRAFACDVSIIENRNTLVDIEIYSSFPFKSMRKKAMMRTSALFSDAALQEYVSRATYGLRGDYKAPAKARIWFSGENVRPPVAGFDLKLSFEPTDPLTNNIYFPYWKSRIDWGWNQKTSEINPTPDQIASNRKLKPKSMQACLFSSNFEPGRERLITIIEPIIPITKFGSAYGNRVKSKLQTSLQYGLQICNENDLYPGYVSEKLQEAWFSANLPIWTGIMPPDHQFNPEAFLDVTNMNAEEIRTRMRNLSLDEVEYRINQPLLLAPPTLSNVFDQIKALTNIL